DHPSKDRDLPDGHGRRPGPPGTAHPRRRPLRQPPAGQRAPVLGPDQQQHLHPRDLAARLALTGLEVPEEAIWTSALATARFLDTQRPPGTAYVLGEAGLTTALHQVGYVL